MSITLSPQLGPDESLAFTLGWMHQSSTPPVMMVNLVCFMCSHTFSHKADSLEDLRREIPSRDLEKCPNCDRKLILVPKKPLASPPS